MSSLFVVTNRALTGKRPLTAVLEEAVQAGADAVILREKDLSPSELYSLACRVKDICLGAGVKLFINTSVEVALACGADGVHLGRGSLPPEAVRRLLPDKTVGVSVHSLEEAVRAAANGADYVMAGHVFVTASKPGLPGRGLDFVRQLSSIISIPVIAIGGINRRNAGEVINAGAAGVAVMSLVMESGNVRKTVTDLKRALL